MRHCLIVAILLCLAIPASATAYFLSPTGNDTNNGLSVGSPWLTPNHPLNCGDTITSASGAYAEANFRTGQWGTVTCPSNNNVAWLQCAVFDTCKITIVSANDAMAPTQSYWGIQGWEVTATATSGSMCFDAFPPAPSTVVHHIIFANNIANGCSTGGIAAGRASGGAGVDYLVAIGNIVYNAAQGNANCFSGLDFFGTNSDTLPGTHYYIAGNFSWGNVDPNPCGGGAPTDGEGILLDTITPYSGQMVIDNNITIFNGSGGIQATTNTGSSPNAKIYIRHNTSYGNQTGGVNDNPCPEINIASSLSTEIYLNIAQTTAATACNVPGTGAVSYFALGASFSNSTTVFYNNFIYSVAGNNNNVGSGATFTNNLTGTSAAFANPVQPSAPSCGSFASVLACMATVIANFMPTAATAKPYGYQLPSNASIYDPLYPQWLCSVTNLPAGLVTPGCLTGANVSGATLSGISIH